MALSQADINEINTLIETYISDNKIKVSTLPEAQSLTGLWILGVSAGASVKASMTLLEGLDGKNPELRNTGIELQWRVEGGTWAKLVDIADIRGFKQMLQKTSTEIQSKYENEQQWQTLLTLSELKGEKGDAFEYSDFTPSQLEELKGAQGDNISLQKTAAHIQWRLGTGAWTDLVALTELKGDTGANIELQKSATHVQWRVQGTSTWNNLILIDDLKVKGDTGANIELQKSTTHVQWRAVGSSTWTNLIALSELKVKGDPGENIELQKTSTHVQWRVVGGSWANLISLSDLKGDTGASVELQVTATYIQWRVQGTSTWSNLIAIADLKGAQGNNIELQKTATYIQWRVVGGSWANLISLSDLKGDTGVGIPTGGVTGQQLTKKSATDYDFEWQTPAGAGDMLKSEYDSDGDGVVDNAEKVNNHTVEEDVPAGAKFTDTIYLHPTSDGNLHVPATGTTNNGKVLKAGATAGSLAWETDNDTITTINGKTGAITKADIVALGIPAQDTVYTHPAGTNPHGTTKADVGLGNVDNVKQIPFSEKGANNGVAELDSSGKVLSSQLPSYVDDVLEYATSTNFPTTGETGKIYIAINTNLTYRWTGTAYTEISPSIALGETSATAYRGDRGKTAYDHSQSAHAPADAQKNSDITKAEIEAKLTGAITSHTHAYVGTSGNETIAGTKTFSTIPVLPASNPTTDNQAARKKYVDDGLSAKLDSSKMQVVASLPGSPDANTYYFIPE